MAKKKKTTKKTLKKKKLWFKVIASPEFKSVSVGETPATAPDVLVGRIIKVNMMTLTRDMRKQSFSASFRVKEVKGTDAITELIKYEMSNVHVKRIVKRGKDKVDDSFVVETKDKVKVRVKPLLITRNKVQHSVHTALRKETQKILADIAKEKDFTDFAVSILTTELQKGIKAALKKIYPVNIAEIRMLKRV